MNKDLIFKYLGYRKITPDQKTLDLISECIKEIESIARFKYIYKEFNEILPFLTQNKNYLKYLEGSTSYLLVGMTLGIDVDRRLTLYQKTDMTKSLIFDCVSSAYIEEVSNDYENNTLPYEVKSYRFCPGYTNTSFLDNQIIAKYLDIRKIGINFLESGLMVPLKSMVGIIAIGKVGKKSCKGCTNFKECDFRKDGVTCYSL